MKNSIGNTTRLVFQRAALRIQGFSPEWKSQGLLSPANGFEDYSHPDGRTATIMTIGKKTRVNHATPKANL